MEKHKNIFWFVKNFEYNHQEMGLMKLFNQTDIFGHPPSHVCFTVFLAINGFYCCFCLTKKKKVDVHNSRGFSRKKN